MPRSRAWRRQRPEARGCPAAVLRHPDQVPRLDDPSARPDEPLTHGLSLGAGAGPEALGPMPVNPAVQTIAAAYNANPTPELRRAMMYLRIQPDGL